MSNIVAATGPTSLSTNGQYIVTNTDPVFKYMGPPTYKNAIVGYTTNTHVTNHPMKKVETNKVSIRTPGFRQLVKTGGILPVNPFEHRSTVQMMNYRTEEYESYVDGAPGTKRTGAGFYYSNLLPLATGSFSQPTIAQLNALDREARLKIRLKLKDQVVNVAMIIAERDKTASAIAKIVRTIAELVLRLKKGDLVGAAASVGMHIGYRKKRQHDNTRRGNPTGALSNAWLELQYAIKPMLMDIDGLIQELARHQYPRATGTAVATSTLNINNQTKDGNLTVIEQGSVKIRYTVYFQIDYPEMPSIARLGLLNPPQLAWELIPFSFIFDWILPIGDWLSSLDATVGMTFADGSKSVKRDLSQIYRTEKITKSGSPGNSQYEKLVDTSSFTEDSIVRTKLSSFPDVAFPPFKNPASLIHLASALALLRKALGR